MSIQIISIVKSNKYYKNPYEAIDYLEWINEPVGIRGLSETNQIYDWLKNQAGIAYVVNKFEKKDYLIPCKGNKGKKYVKSENEDCDIDYLLKLPEFQTNDGLDKVLWL